MLFVLQAGSLKKLGQGQCFLLSLHRGLLLRKAACTVVGSALPESLRAASRLFRSATKL